MNDGNLVKNFDILQNVFPLSKCRTYWYVIQSLGETHPIDNISVHKIAPRFQDYLVRFSIYRNPSQVFQLKHQFKVQQCKPCHQCKPCQQFKPCHIPHICPYWYTTALLSTSRDLGIGLVWDNLSTGPTSWSDCWNPLQTELNYLWWVLSCSQDDIRWF